MPRTRRTEDANQLRILAGGRQRYAYRLEMVPVGSLTIGEHTPPSLEFIRSIEAMGVIQSIVVIDEPSAIGSLLRRYRVIAGRRRAAAAMQLGHERIPAIIFPEGTPPSEAAAISLSENVQRRVNMLDDLEAIERLIGAGHGIEAISQQLGVPARNVRRRMVLTHLTVEMRSALRQGLLAPSLAERVARLPLARQHELAERYTHRGQRVPQTTVREMTAEFHLNGGWTQLEAATDVLPILDDRAHITWNVNTAGQPINQAIHLRNPDLHVIDGRIYHADDEIGEIDVRFDDDGMVAFYARRPNTEDWERWIPEQAANNFCTHTVAVDLAGPGQERTVVGVPELSGQSRENVVTVLSAVIEAVPVSPDDDTDGWFANIHALLERARYNSDPDRWRAEQPQPAQRPRRRRSVPAGER